MTASPDSPTTASLATTGDTPTTPAPRLSPARVQAEIDRRNRVFRAATSAGKRVLLAQDVLVQIKLGTLLAAEGQWVQFKQEDWSLDIKGSAQQRILAQHPGDSCKCCGVGALMLSCTLYKNRVNVEDMNGDFNLADLMDGSTDDRTGFLRIFGRKQAILIEMAFEMGNGRFGIDVDKKHSSQEDIADHHVNESLARRAVRLGNRYGDATKRLQAIMRNIIQHNGTFVP